MHHDIPAIHENPRRGLVQEGCHPPRRTGGRQAFGASHTQAVLAQLVMNVFRHRGHLTRAGRGTDDKKIGDAREGPHIEHDDVFGVFIKGGFRRNEGGRGLIDPHQSYGFRMR